MPTATVTSSPTASARATVTPLVGIAAGRTPGAGTTALPVILLNPTALRFGRQAAGTTSPAQVVHVVNLGPDALSITGVALDGPAAGDFTIAEACRGAAIAVDQGCAIAIRFAPRASGIREARLQIVAADGSQSPVTLQGRT